MMRLLSVCLATLWFTGAAWAQTFGFVPTAPPGDNSNRAASTGFVQGISAGAVNVMAAPYSAVCDGSTDDSSAFTAAIAANNSVLVPVGKTCVVHDVTLAAGQFLDCGGSALKGPSSAGSAQWIVKKTGFNSRIRNCQFNDSANATKHTTTLSGAASPGSTTIGVTSATGMQINQAIAVLLDSGAYHLTKITNIVSTTISLADAIPATQAVTPTVSAGGANYAANDHLIVQGGVGPPITVHVTTVSGSVVTAVALDAPGLYSTFPTSPAATMDANGQTALGATLTLTAAGASSGNIVESAWGALVADNASEGIVDNIIFGSVPAGLQVLNSNGSGSGSGETYSNITVNAFQLFGVFKDVDVHDARFTNIIGFGVAHNSSSFGVAGTYINGANPGSTPTGGNIFTAVNMLNAETAWLDNHGQLENFANIMGDTTRNYGFVCNACSQNTFGQTWMTFTGPSATSGSAGAGGGIYFGNSAINNVMQGLWTVNNAYDIHVADSGSAVWLAANAWGPFKVASGVTRSLQSGLLLFAAASPASVGGTGSTIYLGPSGYATTSGAVNLWSQFKQTVTRFSCASAGAPGAGQSYTCNLLDNGNILGSCSYSGASAFGCDYSGPGIFIFDKDQVALQIVSSASAASSQFRAYVAGL